jgi:predicted secreted protein
MKLRPAKKLGSELAVEAVKEATAQARLLAAAAGATGLEVVDVQVTPLATHTAAETHSAKDGDGTTVNLTATVLLGPPRPPK